MALLDGDTAVVRNDARPRGRTRPPLLYLLGPLLVATTLGSPADADAATDLPTEDQLYIPRLRTPVRAAVGLDFGVGVFDGTCDDCIAAGGLSVDVYAGALLTERIAVFADVWTLAHVLPPSDGGGTGMVFHGFSTVAGRLWMTPEVWMSVGVGAGTLAVVASPRDQDNGFDVGPGFVLAIGSEVEHRPDFGVDLSLRLGSTLLEDTDGRSLELFQVAATAGWHWY